MQSKATCAQVAIHNRLHSTHNLTDCHVDEPVGGAELIMRRPWFVGGSDLEILGKIFQALGTPTEAQWPGMRDLPNFVDFQKTVAPPLASTFKGVHF